MMSDETVVAAETPAETQVPADLTTKIETPNVETQQETEVTAETPPAEETKPEGEVEKKKPSGIDRIKRRLALTQADLDRVAQENEELRRRSVASDPQEGKPGIDRAPTEKDFPSDYLAFEAARTEWNVRQAVRQEMAKGETTKRAAAQREHITERSEAYEDSLEQVRDRIPDFDKTLASATAQVSRELMEEIFQSEKAALLQYHLAKNPEKLRDLNGLSGRELSREIGRLESRVHLPTPKKATEAAPPPSEVRGGAAQTIDPQTGPDEMNAYAKWREKQRKAS